MSPKKLQLEPTERVELSVHRLASELATEVRTERARKRWTLNELADRARLSPAAVRSVEGGAPSSLQGYARIAAAFGWEPTFSLKTERPPLGGKDVDPVHAAMGEIEAAHYRGLGFEVLIDEPYQHYQYHGRGDVLVLDRPNRALLHHENRTRFPDVQGFGGSWNSKRAYLADALAERLQIRGGWRSITHVVVALWSSEVLHPLRLRTETFRSLCPDAADAFAAWWGGDLATLKGTTASLVVFDPLEGIRTTKRRWVDLDTAVSRSTDPRYRGYADALEGLKAAGLA